MTSMLATGLQCTNLVDAEPKMHKSGAWVWLAHLCHHSFILDWVEGAGGVDHAAPNLQQGCRVQRNAQLQRMQAIAVLLRPPVVQWQPALCACECDDVA